MRKLSLILALMLTLCLCLPAYAEQTVITYAEESTADVGGTTMSYAEVENWAMALLSKAAQEETRNDPSASHSEDGYAFEYEFGTLYLNTPTIGEDTVLLSAEIVSPEVPDPHGATVYMFAQEIMACYAQTNTELVGSKTAAVVYADGALPDELRWGCVYRDGQRMQIIEYAAIEAAPEGYSFAGVSYTMYENMALAIRVYGVNQPMTEDEAIQLSSMVDDIQAETSYRQVPSSYKGSELAMFDEADLSFGGLDLHEVKPEQMALLLGTLLQDNWVEDGNGGFIRVMEYADCQLILNYDSSKQNPKVDSLSITSASMEGPRCLRIGDSLTSVRNRFRYGEGIYDEETMIDTLYMPRGEEGPCGTADYSMDGIVILNYQAPMEDGRMATLMLTFENMYMTDLMVVLQ